jgi:hypothetical protein
MHLYTGTFGYRQASWDVSRDVKIFHSSSTTYGADQEGLGSPQQTRYMLLVLQIVSPEPVNGRTSSTIAPMFYELCVEDA